MFLVGNKTGGNPPQQPVELWIPTGQYDILVLSVQECMYESLFERVIAHLGEDYCKLDRSIYVSVFLTLLVASILTVKMAVFVHKGHVAKIRNIEVFLLYSSF